MSRSFALWDNMIVPENMKTCIFDTYSFEHFWRNWHCGFNLWLIRYIYIPLNGRNSPVRNIFIVFTFVAVWHE